jgi:hypothetical protein
LTTQVSDQQDLYGLPLEEFVSARGALAKTLRKQDKREQAQEVAALRKPSVAAWAVNQLVRTQQREVAAVFSAGDALQAAQSQLLAGKGDARGLREAVDREREAVETLAGRAHGLLSADGHELTQTTLDRVSETLHAAALDAEARSEVEQGCLRRELRHVGLGAFSAVSTPASPAGKVAPKASSEPRAPDRSRDNAEARRAKREAEQRAAQARAAEAAARRAAGRAERALQTATARRENAAQSLADADAELAAAAKVAKQAAEEHRRAKQALERP